MKELKFGRCNVNIQLQGLYTKAAFSLPQIWEHGAWTGVIFDLCAFREENQDAITAL